MPAISILMPVRNARPYVDEAVRSILTQSRADFEFLVLDDASDDGTWELLQLHARQDSRIKLCRNDTSVGVAVALQLLFQRSTGEYIARMDADDISEPRRLETQVAFLEGKRLDVCGSWVLAFGAGRPALRRHPVTDEEIKAQMLFVAPFTHPTVVMRRRILERHPYLPEGSGEVPVLEDNDLWVRMAADARMGNVPAPLLRYREHAGQVSATDTERFWTLAGEIGLRHLETAFGIQASATQRAIHIGVRHPRPPRDRSAIKETEAWLLMLGGLFPERPAARRVVAQQWYRYAIKCASLGPGVYLRFRRSELCRYGEFSLWQKAAVAILSLLRVRYNSSVYRYLAARSPASRV